jgi:D-inositol-3-phosphate glycosyltransferase
VIDKVVAISTETKQYLQSFFPIPDNKITIINLGVDRDKFTFLPSARITQRERLGIPQDAFLIIYAGKIIPAKKCDWVYEIAKEYLQANPNVFLLFVGSGIDSEYAHGIKQLTRQDGVEHQVIWHAHIPHEELPHFFSAADVAIWPFQETMAALEAASCSLPIILRDSQIAREYTDNENGFACPSLNDQKFALGELIGKPSLCRHMGNKGTELTANRYDWRIIARLFINVHVE